MPAIDEEDRPKKKLVHEIGQDLSLISVGELNERIALSPCQRGQKEEYDSPVEKEPADRWRSSPGRRNANHTKATAATTSREVRTRWEPYCSQGLSRGLTGRARRWGGRVGTVGRCGVVRVDGSCPGAVGVSVWATGCSASAACRTGGSGGGIGADGGGPSGAGGASGTGDSAGAGGAVFAEVQPEWKRCPGYPKAATIFRIGFTECRYRTKALVTIFRSS